MKTKTCSSCFRYCENWRDAEAKGYKRVSYYGIGEYFYKPRPGVKLHAIGVKCPDDSAIRPDFPACKHHEYRWLWNIKTWWNWRFTPNVAPLYRKFIRRPIGGPRKPVPLEWKDYFDGVTDSVIPNGEPICPHCGEYPYSEEQCAFCGRRFLPDESGYDKTAPQREMQD